MSRYEIHVKDCDGDQYLIDECDSLRDAYILRKDYLFAIGGCCTVTITEDMSHEY